jgi:hypothetical protein
MIQLQEPTLRLQALSWVDLLKGREKSLNHDDWVLAHLALPKKVVRRAVPNLLVLHQEAGLVDAATLASDRKSLLVRIGFGR